MQSPLPFQAGYTMPPEWAPHEATWLAWPHNSLAWEPHLKAVQEVWVEIARILSLVEKVRLLVADRAAQEEVRRRLRDAGAAMERVSLERVPTVDIWIRDYGPTFVARQGGTAPVAANSWVFNAWGNKYEAWLKDDRVASQVARLRKIPLFECPLVLEGGSIEVNGSGTCLSTEQCLLNANRNPGRSRREIEQILRDHLGITRQIWLGCGLYGDDTDGHIDNLARFVNPTTVVSAIEQNPRDENYRALQENYERLQGAKDQDGRKIEIVPLPVPGKVEDKGVRLPASYANFYIANEIVLVPVFGHPNDGRALEILGALFPGRKTFPIPCATLIYGLGAVHCMTQQEPAAPLST